MNSKYLYRSDDYQVFQRKSDGEYEIMDNSPNHIKHSHKYETLMYYNFKECTEDDFDWLEEKSREYYSYMNWSSRPDGHGGRKGGTMEEYKEYLERVKRYEEKIKETT